MIGAAAGIGALWLIRRSLSTGRASRTRPPTRPRSSSIDRVRCSAALALGAAFVGAVGRRLGGRFTAAESRAAVRLPGTARSRSPALPRDRRRRRRRHDAVRHAERRLLPHRHRAHRAAGADRRLPLRVTGMVDDELELSYDDLLARPMIERDITLTCVSNEVGGRYVGNARWLGTRLDDLLERGRRAARRRPGRRPLRRRVRVRVPGRRRDGRARRDGRRRHERRAAADRARLPGPPRRARPVRLRVGDQVADRDRADDVRRLRPLLAAPRLGAAGADQADEPDRHAPRAGQGPRRHACRSPAWRGRRRSASRAVEVSIDDGAWQPAELGTVPSRDTWRQWVLPLGRHSRAATR